MKSRGKGLLFAGLGASLWGSAGVTGQVLMDTYHLPATALSVWRLILSGFLLLGLSVASGESAPPLEGQGRCVAAVCICCVWDDGDPVFLFSGHSVQ